MFEFIQYYIIFYTRSRARDSESDIVNRKTAAGGMRKFEDVPN